MFLKSGSNNNKERRYTKRKELHQNSFFAIDSNRAKNVFECYITNISAQGVGFQSDIRVKRGQDVTIIFNLRHGVIREKAKIVRHTFFTINKYGAQFLGNTNNIANYAETL